MTMFLTTIFPDKISTTQIQRCFVLSKKYIVDEQEEFEKYFTLELREFYEFIVRVSPVVMKEDWPLFYTVDRMLQRIEKILNQE